MEHVNPYTIRQHVWYTLATNMEPQIETVVSQHISTQQYHATHFQNAHTGTQLITYQHI